MKRKRGAMTEYELEDLVDRQQGHKQDAAEAWYDLSEQAETGWCFLNED